MVAGVIIVTFGLLPLVVARFGRLAAPGLWLVYAVVLTAMAAVLLTALGVGVVLIAPAAAAWMAYSEHRRVLLAGGPGT